MLSFQNQIKEQIQKKKRVLLKIFLSWVLSKKEKKNPFPENPIIWNENKWLLPPISMLEEMKYKIK